MAKYSDDIVKDSILITYDCASKTFSYPASADTMFGVDFGARPFWQVAKEARIMPPDQADNFEETVLEFAVKKTPQVFFAECVLRDASGEKRTYEVGFMCPFPGNQIHITFTDINDRVPADHTCVNAHHCDELTGLLERKCFYNAVQEIMDNDKAGVMAGEYALLHFDVIRFKAINDIFGLEAGDRVLMYIADIIEDCILAGDVACRADADRFHVFTHSSGEDLEKLIHDVLDGVSHYQLPFEIACNVGIFVTGKELLSVDAMIDRAIIAQSVIKGSYTKKLNYYTEDLRHKMLGELEIVGMIQPAFEERHFVVYYQPQYSHTTGHLVGAEALVRWNHPDRGLIAPGVFIPIFEKNGFITKLDLYVFEEVCGFIRRCMDKEYDIVPISSNFSRHDIFLPDFVERLEEIRKRYDVPAEYLRVEITESAAMDNPKYTNDIIRKLHACGYIVEMDDFGSGYSSLNVLKDIELDIIKLDMLFMSQDTESKRGGTILSSIVRMAKWLGMPVIAEGVENVEQADFLRSIGCDCIQGYLYSKPLSEEEYEKILRGATIGIDVIQMEMLDILNANDFWDPKSQETLIFSNYVGAAAIYDYRDGQLEILRVNPKCLQELGNKLTEKDLIESNPWTFFDDENRKTYEDMIKRAIETGEEQECDTWQDIVSSEFGTERFCIHTNIYMIGKSEDACLFYAMIRNVTTEKLQMLEVADNERRFKMMSEQMNIYFWDYDVRTREMRPCFRCIRDLGFPEKFENYPESAIEMGIFPQEVAELYREWHIQIANGVKELEAVIPMTKDCVPFRIRYTTEFDEAGMPIKAYASAAPMEE